MKKRLLLAMMLLTCASLQAAVETKRFTGQSVSANWQPVGDWWTPGDTFTEEEFGIGGVAERLLHHS